MAEDYRWNGQTSNDSILFNTLTSINCFLESMGKSIKQYELPALPTDSANKVRAREIEDEMSIQTPFEDHMLESKLNPEQQVAFSKILQKINSKESGMFFVDGPGGTGKTFIYRALLAHLRGRKMIALATATSGVAAALLAGGRTAHSRFKIPINANEASFCNVTVQSGTAKLLRKADLIIWNEAPMAKRFAIETLNRTMQDVMETNLDFGGKVVVFGGDFRQVLLVVPKATKEETIEASLVKSELWKKMEILTLTRNMRAEGDPYCSDFLLQVGNGDEHTSKDDMTRIPDQLLLKYDKEDIPEQCLINKIFPCLQENAHSIQYIAERAILAAKNDTVDMLSKKLIDQFPGTKHTFLSFDAAEDDTNNYYQEEFLNSLNPNGLPPHKLELKENAPIMLLRNLDPSNGLCNGTRMVCRHFQHNVIHAEITAGQHKGVHVLLPRIPLSPAENEGYPFKFKRKQYPIRLCFAMTINKSQGQTIPHVGIYLPQPIFSHGQLYVALSRERQWQTQRFW
nr:ATP-dependent DNA helicase PIF1-like [Coffea arabica]